eukprot:2310769-Amphidinium_carterae.1
MKFGQQAVHRLFSRCAYAPSNQPLVLAGGAPLAARKVKLPVRMVAMDSTCTKKQSGWGQKWAKVARELARTATGAAISQSVLRSLPDHASSPSLSLLHSVLYVCTHLPGPVKLSNNDYVIQYPMPSTPHICCEASALLPFLACPQSL